MSPKLLSKPATARFRSRRLASEPGLKSGVDREGGDNQAGLLRGISVVTEGEALGHRLWLDATFARQVADAINAAPRGVKSRYTHPSIVGDGLGRYLGRVKNARIDGDRVLADLHFAQAAHNTPEGDLAAYLMDLASEDPEAFGVSIAFEYRLDGTEPDNPMGYPHPRLAELRAVDFVDEPAANPSGLFLRLSAGDRAMRQVAAIAALQKQCAELQQAIETLPASRRGFVSKVRFGGGGFRAFGKHEQRPEPAKPTGLASKIRFGGAFDAFNRRGRG